MDRFRVLIVEDEDMTREQLVKLYAVALPESIIDSCEDVEAGLECIDTSLRRSEMYDLAILDFRLPRHAGEVDAVDESVCRLLRRAMPDTIVGHITGFAHDPAIMAHLSQVHPTGELRSFFLDKRDSSFAMELIHRSRQALFDTRIDRELFEIFPNHVAAMRLHRIQERWDGPSVSNRIVDLSLDIGLVWRELGPDTKERVLRVFEIQEESQEGTVLVTLR